MISRAFYRLVIDLPTGTHTAHVDTYPELLAELKSQKGANLTNTKLYTYNDALKAYISVTNIRALTR